jgi:hypothetical protein
MKNETADFFSQAIIGEIIHNGTAMFLIERLRVGHAQFISQEAWLIIADYLEKNLPKSVVGRPEENHWLRDKLIANRFDELRGLGKLQEESYNQIADELATNYSTVKAVVNEHRKEIKEIIAIQNDPKRYIKGE